MKEESSITNYFISNVKVEIEKKNIIQVLPFKTYISVISLYNAS
jgi:hypothetical protein